MVQREYLSKREQQIMEVVYRHGEVSAAQVQAELPGRPANSSVRTLLTILERKGWLRHEEERGKYIYLPARPHQEAAKSAVQGVLHTFFNGSLSGLVTTLISGDEAQLTEQDLSELKQLIAAAEERQ